MIRIPILILTSFSIYYKPLKLSGDDGHPDWMVLVGLMHDMGKVLCLFGEPQWAVVGDTFPVGCAYSDKVVYPEYFKNNPDFQNSTYQTESRCLFKELWFEKCEHVVGP